MSVAFDGCQPVQVLRGCRVKALVFEPEMKNAWDFGESLGKCCLPSCHSIVRASGIWADEFEVSQQWLEFAEKMLIYVALC
jgi:hypothetical protein